MLAVHISVKSSKLEVKICLLHSSAILCLHCDVTLRLSQTVVFMVFLGSFNLRSHTLLIRIAIPNPRLPPPLVINHLHIYFYFSYVG